MSEKGSVSEWQKFFAIGAKLPGSFRDRAAARPMAGNGWLSEWQQSKPKSGERILLTEMA
jgi:hypothetical protein